MANRLAVNFNQRIWDSEVRQVAAMRTMMLPLVDVASGDWSLTDEPVDTLFASITDVFDFYSRNLATYSGHVLIIKETGLRLNPDSCRSKSLDQLPQSAPSGSLQFRVKWSEKCQQGSSRCSSSVKQIYVEVT